MGFFEVGDGDGGAIADRVAIVIIICFAFSWIPVMIIWKIVTVCREGRVDVEDGNMPVTTRAPSPKKKPQPVFTPGVARGEAALARQSQNGHGAGPDDSRHHQQEYLPASAHFDADYQTSIPPDVPDIGPIKHHVDNVEMQHLDGRHSDGFLDGQTQESGALNNDHAPYGPYREDASRSSRSSRRSRSRRDRNGHNDDEPPVPSLDHSQVVRSQKSRRADRDTNNHYLADPLRLQHSSSHRRSHRGRNDSHQDRQEEGGT